MYKLNSVVHAMYAGFGILKSNTFDYVLSHPHFSIIISALFSENENMPTYDTCGSGRIIVKIWLFRNSMYSNFVGFDTREAECFSLVLTNKTM